MAQYTCQQCGTLFRAEMRKHRRFCSRSCSGVARHLSLTGQRFGRWVVMAQGQPTRRFASTWWCRCDCGTERLVKGWALKGRDSLSCGCLQRETTGNMHRSHGDSKSREYGVWCGIITRCENKADRAYHQYGGRGITMCRAWRTSYEQFLADMGRAPSPKHSVDRVNNEQGYTPDNCRWATKQEQANNTRANHILSWNGREQTISEWARERGIKTGTLASRIYRGWPVERALMPVTPCKKAH